MLNIRKIWVGLLLFVTAGAHAEVGISFDHTGANLIGVQTIELAFSIAEDGLVSMDASTSSDEQAHIDAVDAWDSADVGSVSDPALHGKRFVLSTITSSSTGENVSLYANDGGVLAIQGQNSGRIDGGGLPTPKPESLGWLLAGSVRIKLTEVTYANAHPSGKLKISDADTSLLFDLPGTQSTGALDVSSDDFLVRGGEVLDTTSRTSPGPVRRAPRCAGTG